MSEGNISLYFKLKPDQTADLEIVANAALEWLYAVRAAASELEPGAQVRIGLIDADEGSLRLNAVFDWLEGQLERVDKGSSRYPRLRKLAVALAIFLPTTGAQTYSYYFPPQQEVSLKEDDKKLLEENNALLRELIGKAQKNPEVETRRKKFFRMIEKDTAITAAGLTESRDSTPLVMIPASQFAEKSGLWAISDDQPTERVIYPTLEVTLIAPVLLPIPRSWRFQPEDGLPEFTAKMKDMQFLEALKSDHVKERLRTGIKMTVRLKVKEQKIGDVWVTKRGGRSVVEVIHPKVA
ncbi:MAG: hypothetical protein HXX15_21240 [Rhodopseudomonas sp.]|uniref:hypothetical protein n=1 Tax=Rhodopseudomonas sp. TaxID=1078 RepID=UPI00182070E2|nr:hypothetical protein [Rhodopseudomonas sp.]NVN88612.1 hypothetical protein [Rhodopseudomonas sp.]